MNSPFQPVISQQVPVPTVIGQSFPELTIRKRIIGQRILCRLVIGQPFAGKPVLGLQDLKGRDLPHFGPYAKERANIIAGLKQGGGRVSRFFDQISILLVVTIRCSSAR